MLLKKINNYMNSILFSKLELAQKNTPVKTRVFFILCKRNLTLERCFLLIRKAQLL